MAATPTYLIYLILIHHILWCLLSASSLYFSANMLFQRKLLTKSSNLSPTLSLYFIYVFFLSVVTIVYCPYFFIFFRFETVIYDSRWFFIFGISPFLIIIVNPLVELFLCIDRCISIIYPIKYTKPRQLFFAFTSFVITATVITFFYAFNVPFYPAESQTECRFFNCLIAKSTFPLLFIKLGFIILNIFASLIFAFLFKRILSNTTTMANKATKRMNKTILIILVATILIEFIPFLIAQSFLTIIGQSIANFIGPYGSVFSASTILLSSWTYYKALNKTIKYGKKITVFT